MSYLEAILLGIVQGITEFLPISSDGHLLIVEHWLGRKVDNVAINVALHAGTLLSIVVYFFRDLLEALRKPRLIVAIVVATLPLIPLGLFGKRIIDETLNTTTAAGAGLLVTAAFLFLATRLKEGTRTLDEITPLDGLVVGLFQVLAPAPGVSRSGSTILGGLLRGMTRDAAARFAFLIAVPAISGALVLYSRKLLKGEDGEALALGPLAVGAGVSFVVGIAAIRVLMAMVIKMKLAIFAWYCLILGSAVLIMSLTSPGATHSPGESPAPAVQQMAAPPADSGS
ncbi:Undecaprenyl-diphosphatase [Caulifigura coniformis]|uniref:Undecaprenyl-diphosphatase n=1 Tax=Caulifigura coniformis TaxID=2527983 RepID=A0A517SGK4_9PLAN|nr:undecaprenyl-diphosphate phosphatase [Caulifigura coniformis]QDT55217.1 Undecaprenyl-diphosphatase [Caulifigura coniformis]